MQLEGLRVLDLSANMPGPYMTLLMADNGAEVTKIEPPGGEPGRRIGIVEGESGVFFRNLNRGKRSIVLDLKDPAERERLLAMCETADVFVEGYRPGVAARLGIGYAAIAARNPRIVYCSISAFGQDGPYRDIPAHSLALEALAGVVSLTEGQDGRPTIPGVAAADFLSGLHALSGVLMALYRRNTTGRGEYIDVSMLDSTLAALPNVVAPAFAEGRDVVPKEERNLGGAAFYQVYETSDGRHVALAGQEEKFLHSVLNDFGRPDLFELCARGPGPHQKPVIEFFRRTFRTRTRDEWVEHFRTLDACFAPVKSVREAFEDPHVRARGMLLVDERGRRHIGPAIKFRNEPSRPVLEEPACPPHPKAG